MAITVDNVSSVQGTSGTTETISHAVAGSNRYLFVGVGLSASTPGTVTGVTYNGVAMTELWEVFNGGNHRCYGWGLVAPDVGTHDIVVTFSGAVDEFEFGGISFNGVDQGTPVGTPNENSDDATTTATVNISSAADELVVDHMYCAGTAIAIGGGQTSRWEQENIGGNSGGTSTEPGAGSVTMSWTITGGEEWAMGGISLKPAAEGAAPDLPDPHGHGPALSQRPPRMIPSGSFKTGVHPCPATAHRTCLGGPSRLYPRRIRPSSPSLLPRPP